MWNDLILAHEGPSDTRDTKIAAMRLKFNAFKALEGEKVNGTFTRLKYLLNDLENNGVIIPQAEVNATNDSIRGLKGLGLQGSQWTSLMKFVSPVESKDTFRKNVHLTKHPHHYILHQTNPPHHHYKGKYKGLKAEIVVLTKKINAILKGKSEKGLVAKSFDWDEESVSSEDEGTTKVKAFMAISKEEPSVGKAGARSDYTRVDLHYVEDQRKNLVNKFNLLKQELSLHNKVTFDQLLSKQIPGNIVKALGERGKRKEKISSKEVIFTKADESLSMPIPDITSDSESECETQEPLPKLIGAAPADTSNSLISLANLTLNIADLTLNISVPKKTKPTSDKVSPTYAIKKKTETMSPVVPVPQPKKKADLFAEQLLLTLMDEVKSLKEQIKVPSDNSPSVSQTGSSKSSKGKQTTWSGPSRHQGTLLNNMMTFVPHAPKKEMSMSLICHLTMKKAMIVSLPRPIKPQTISHKKYTLVIVDEYSRYTWVFCLKKKSDAADCIISFIKKMENLNEVRVKELRSDNGTEFRNHKLEVYLRISHLLVPLNKMGEAINTACYTQNISIIVKRHGKTAYDVFRGRSPNIIYFNVFGCPVHIHSHRDLLGKFDENVDDGFFLGYSLVAKAFRVFNIKRQEMEEIYHVTFSEDDEAISQSSTGGDAINFNENRSFPNDEFLKPRNKVTQCSVNIEYFTFIPAYETILENISPTDSPILQDLVSPEEPPEFTSADDHPAPNDQDHPKLADNLKPAKIQDTIISEPITNVQPSPTIILQPPVP
ncbi:retrovirus-related pol polyprotein from transposon TNT 1-94 [Tanacetum coccineum]